MNQAHWHLVVNHLPIIFPIVGIIVIITGFISKSEAVKRTAYLVFVIGALTAIFAMNTGEGAEEVAERISGINESYIEQHEESAETFAVLSYFLGAFSLVGLWVSFKQEYFSNLLSVITLLFSLVVLYFGKHTGTTGGEIRHSEIRTETNQSENNNQNFEEEDDD